MPPLLISVDSFTLGHNVNSLELIYLYVLTFHSYSIILPNTNGVYALVLDDDHKCVRLAVT